MQPGQCLNGKCMHFNKARIKQLKEIVVRIAFTASQLVNPQWQLYFSHKGKSWPSSAEHLQNSNKLSHGIRQHPVWKIIKKKKSHEWLVEAWSHRSDKYWYIYIGSFIWSLFPEFHVNSLNYFSVFSSSHLRFKLQDYLHSIPILYEYLQGKKKHM